MVLRPPPPPTHQHTHTHIHRSSPLSGPFLTGTEAELSRRGTEDAAVRRHKRVSNVCAVNLGDAVRDSRAQGTGFAGGRPPGANETWRRLVARKRKERKKNKGCR
ncbi:MAG: hypothetical protein BJ554DRAFT_525 [Olpidium bornovanus]|uniref:Uncharacterized protein n=1 Tax=Olpidium bornovanus TaxID=278681 RepID=A0A8H8A1I0_9FUNG|nr:MAG: hypothetical protein BJ554DRAFT_525 [Olpidium bornovanus]